MTWRLAKSLDKLRAEVNDLFPGRSKVSDGTIGDAAHATRTSDHNPWVKDGTTGIVTAIDITEDAERGIPEIADFIVSTLVERRDPRVKYIIHEGRIWRSYDKPGIPAWTSAPYTGTNGHFKHVHVSVQPEKVRYDSLDSWGLEAAFREAMAPKATRVTRARELLTAALKATTNTTRKTRIRAGLAALPKR
ncbi:MAG TPA: hypothetical protein VJL80_06400 [Aeromicrobium sp.]|nr:hypothetical protein [Aeromicrobium sp.]HKY57649.1 hypothetical protein [Aeromicrobium sp.]